MLLYGKPVIEKLFLTTQHFLVEHWYTNKRVVFFLLSDDIPSRVYVNRKVAYAKKLGLRAEILWSSDRSFAQVLTHIEHHNNDADTVGIVIQLPLAPHLSEYKEEIINAVTPIKDIDALSAYHVEHRLTGKSSILPATAQAVLSLLDFYGYGAVRDQHVLVIGQSHLVWLPLTHALQQRGAIVLTATSITSPDELTSMMQQATIIISATGQYHLLGESFLPFLRPTHILIDVGRGLHNGQPVGDMDRQLLEAHVWAITPVPWWVWPVTIACLFDTLCRLMTGKIDPQ